MSNKSLIVIPLLLTACATVQNYQSTVNTWQGAHKNELVRVWGLPDKEIEMPHGRDIYVYKYQRRARSTTNVNMVDGQAYVTRSDAGSLVQYQTCTTWFSVNQSGIIDEVQFQGDACEASSKFKQRYAAPPAQSHLPH